MPKMVNDDAHAAFSSCSSAPVRPHRLDRNAPSGKLCHAARSHDSSRRADVETQKQRLPRSTQLPISRRVGLRWGGHSLSRLPLMWTILCGLLLSCVEAEYIVQVANPLDGQPTALLFDRSEPPFPPPRIRIGIEKRQEQESISATPSFIPAPTAAVGRGEDSSSLFGIPTATGSPREDLPTPFDTSLGNNFTAPSCPAFFQSFLSNATFQDCLPFSLLLQTSNSFFTTTRSLVDLTRTLDATCSVPNLEQCVATMSNLAAQLQSLDHCGADFELENPMVRQAYAGFVAYQPLYHAGCLTNNAGDYCYAAAVNNASATTAAYVYYLPLGVSLPASTTQKAGCSQCLRDTMSVFALYAADKAQPLSETYASAAEQLDGTCGAKFVEAAKVSTNGAASTMTATSARLGFFVAMLMLFFLE